MSRPSRETSNQRSRPPRESYPSQSNDSLAPPLLQTTSYESQSRVQFQETNQNSRTDEQNLGFSNSEFRRKKSLVRPDRERVDENHRLFNYRNHTVAMEAEGRGITGFSRTGHYPSAGLEPNEQQFAGNETSLRRGKSILAREEGMVNESGLKMFKRATTLRRPGNARANSESSMNEKVPVKDVKQPLGIWMIFCLTLTLCCPAPMLSCFGESILAHKFPISKN